MYNALIRINLIGFTDEEMNDLNNVETPQSIKCEFIKSSTPRESDVSKSDVVILKSEDANVASQLKTIREHTSDKAKVILAAPHGSISSPDLNLDSLYDFWAEPMSAKELEFHINKLIRSCKTELDLWESTQFLDSTINSIPSLVWYKTHDGVHEKVNDSFCKTVNKTKEQVQGQRHAYIWDVEEDDPACIESENQVMASGKTCVSEETIQVGDSTKLLTTYKTPLYNYDGSVMGTVGVGIDVTQERQYQSDLLEKSNSLETIFTSLDCGILTHSLDGSRILGVNQKALDLLGFTSEKELADKGFDMVASTVVEEDATRLREEFKQLKEVGDTLSTEYSVVHEDGKTLHIMGNIKLIENDGEKYYQRFLLDITEQKALEQQKDLRSHHLIQALSEDYLVVCTFDLQTGKGEVLRAVEDDTQLASIFNGDLDLDDTVKVYIDVRVHADDQQMLQDALSVDTIKNELKLKNRFDRLYKTRLDGMVRFRQVTVVRSGDWDESHEVIMGFRNVDQQIRDELEQKTLLEEALGNANKANAAKSSFLLSMSHDIRTPMNAIIGFTTLAANHIDQTDKVVSYLNKIKASSDHLLNLINDILDVSRIEQGKLTLDENQMNITEVLDDLYSMLHQQAESKGLNFSVDASGVVHQEIICDRLKVNQILLNLIGNAIKFTEAGGYIRASIEELPGGRDGFSAYKMVVEDTGMGMPADFLDLIFDPFERVQSSTVNGIQGSGLGMAIVKSLVDMMDGSIEVESELGRGTKFTVNLVFPIAKDVVDQVEDSRSEPVIFTPDRASKYRILLVDDNPLNREIAEDILLDSGFRVNNAENGQDALNKVKEAGPGFFDLILMDIQMPIMNGYEAASAIRALEDPTLSSIPILAVTADAFDEDRKRALDHGMNGHLPKPIEVSKLFEFLDTLLGD